MTIRADNICYVQELREVLYRGQLVEPSEPQETYRGVTPIFQ